MTSVCRASPTATCRCRCASDPHEYPRRREASRKQLDEFLRNGTGTNHCLVDDADAEPAVADGVCSFPSLSGCSVDETDAQDLCIPDELP